MLLAGTVADWVSVDDYPLTNAVPEKIYTLNLHTHSHSLPHPPNMSTAQPIFPEKKSKTQASVSRKRKSEADPIGAPPAKCGNFLLGFNLILGNSDCFKDQFFVFPDENGHLKYERVKGVDDSYIFN